MIRYQDISKIFPNGTQALADVNLEIEPSEFVFLVGPSGAGKTTLLKFLIREDKPTSGEIWFQNEEIVSLPARFIPLLRRRIGMVFQDFKLLERRTVFENVAFALEVVSKLDAEIREVVPYVLERVGLKDKIHAFPFQLSAGEQQRVALARALVHEPEVLLADEPTGNLDDQNTWQIIDLLKQINEWGTTVIMATHDQEIVKSLRKRVVYLNQGRVVREE